MTSPFDDFLEAVTATGRANPSWRYGQTVFNTLYFGGWDSEYANEIRGTALDPFYNDDRATALMDKLRERWATQS